TKRGRPPKPKGRGASPFFDFSNHEATLPIRADDDSPTGKGRSQARHSAGREARPAENRQRDRTEGAKSACGGCGYLEGGQVARDRDWHSAAHLKGASNEPARGGAMTSGPQLTNSLLRCA